MLSKFNISNLTGLKLKLYLIQTKTDKKKFSHDYQGVIVRLPGGIQAKLFTSIVCQKCLVARQILKEMLIKTWNIDD